MSDDAPTTEARGVDPAETGVDVQPVDTAALPTHAEPTPELNGERRPVLELRDVSTHYGLVAVLRNVNVEIYPGEMVCLLGGNASGKTTTLKTILGYVKPTEGDVVLDGEVVTGLPTSDVVSKGISMVPENRRLFANMTVSENLDLGAYQRKDKPKIAEGTYDEVANDPQVIEAYLGTKAVG